jgi:hypothetical protein
MSVKPFRLNRRSFLRGVLGGSALVSLPLPPLEAMFNFHGDALAQGQAIAKRFGIWFWGNGVRRAHWVPDGTGSNWTPRIEMEPLTRTAALKPYLSVVSGMEIKTATHPHHSGMAGIFTGQRYHELGRVRDTIASTFAAPSIDQVVAERWAADPATRAPFRSLEVGICRFHGTDEGTTFQHLSHNGPSNVNASEYMPFRLFERLFGQSTSAQVDAARLSVLDAVKTDITSLKPKLSNADKLRLDQHFESIRSIELRLSRLPSQCLTPSSPASAYPDDMGQEPIQAKNEIMSDLIVMALACDLTRVVSVLFSTAGAGTRYWQVGAQNSLHQIAHDERASGAELQPTVHAATIFKMEQLAYFLNRLRQTPEGAGNLLDNCGFLCTTELSEGYTHSNDEFPIILVGKAGGALRGGYHYRSPNKENTSKVLLTLLRAMGDPRPSFGVAEGQVTDVISDLMV